jgi:hypothetical protein
MRFQQMERRKRSLSLPHWLDLAQILVAEIYAMITFVTSMASAEVAAAHKS